MNILTWYFRTKQEARAFSASLRKPTTGEGGK